MTMTQPPAAPAKSRVSVHIFWLVVIGLILTAWALWYTGVFTRRPRVIMITSSDTPYWDLVFKGAEDAAWCFPGNCAIGLVRALTR